MKYFFHSLLVCFIVLTYSNYGLTNKAPNPPFYLRCYDQINPVGVNAHPYFGWYISDVDDH
ncbi:MAG TPA: hypothetical protein PKD85_13595, partial [Saprospiraceae bacterium]|nr:hypothetical protein [Saprospiraceae bacterium]